MTDSGDDPYSFGLPPLERYGQWWRDPDIEDEAEPVHMKTTVGPFILRAWSLSSGGARFTVYTDDDQAVVVEQDAPSLELSMRAAVADLRNQLSALQEDLARVEQGIEVPEADGDE